MTRIGDRVEPGERLRLAETCRRVARVYVEQARFLLPLALMLFVPLGLLDAAGEHLAELEFEELEWAEIAALGLAIGLQVVGAALGEVFYAGVAMAGVTESMEGRPRPGVRHVFRHLPFLPLIGVDVLFSLGLAIGIVLLVVPGLVFFARYVLAAPLLEIERRGVPEAFRRSRLVARGHALVVLALLGGLWLLTDALTTALQEGAPGALGESFLADWGVAVVVSVIVTPVWAVAACVVAWRLLQIERGTAAAAAAA